MAERGVAAVVVRNTANHDARVLRCARTLRSLGYETVVLAVTSELESAERSLLQGVPVLRLTPRAPLAGLARRLRRGPGEPSRDRAAPVSPGNPGERSGPGPAARAYRLLRTLSYYRQAIAAIRRLRPSIVHCNDYNTMWIGVAARLLTGSAVVYDSHELWPDRNGRSEPRWWLLACEALFLRVADCSLATSPGHAAEIGRRHRVAPPRVIRNIAEQPPRNGSDAGRGASREQPGWDGHPTIAYAGAITAHRGLEQAIAALAQAPGVTLRTVGPGDERYLGLLSDLAARHGVEGRILLSPPVRPEHVVTELRHAAAGAALIQPACLSYTLSLPNKLFEYIAAGLPVLAADVPVIAEFVRSNGVGLVVGAGDTTAIARAMTEIAEPARNRELREAVREAASRLSWEREAEQLKLAYREAVGEAGAGAAR